MDNHPATLRAVTGETMLLQGVTARGSVNGLLFELAVEQRYRNAVATNIEAVYTFPLPSGAVLLGFDVELNGKTLSGVVVEKSDAEAQYEDAVEKGDTAIMLERAGDGLCTVNLGNLMAGEEAAIRYRYAQLLRFEHGSVRLAVPTVIAPRYGNPSEAGLQPHQHPTSDLGAAYPLTLAIDLHGDLAKGTVTSPSHRITTAASGDGVTVSLVNDAWLDRDFVLSFDQLAARSFATIARDGDGYVALASFCADVPRNQAEAPLRLKVLVDCSGSMCGDSIEAAKRALHRIFEGMTPADRFTLSRFGNQVVHDVSTMTAAHADAIRSVAKHVSAMDANLGGTEMEGALRAVFALGGNDGEQKTHANARRTGDGGLRMHEGSADILLITDGEIWNADSLVAAARAAGQRVFTVGIGAAPAEGMMRRLAETTGGACEFVAPSEDAEAGILRMFARLRSPCVDHADITWPGTPTWVTSPPRGLFGGETVHVFAGFDVVPTGDVAIRLLPTGEGDTLSAHATLPATSDASDTLPRMAGAKRIETADAESRLALALQHQLLTDATNFIVVHARAEGEKAQDLPKLQTVAQMLAAGWGGMGSVVASRSVSMSTFLPSFVTLNLDVNPVFRDLGVAGLGEPTYAHERGATRFDRESGTTNLEHVVAVLDLQFAGSSHQELPRCLADLALIGVDQQMLDALAALLSGDVTEDDVVRAFLEALAAPAKSSGASRQLQRALRNAFKDANECADLRSVVALIVSPSMAVGSPAW